MMPPALRSQVPTTNFFQPSDEYSAQWDFRGDAKMARFGFVLGWLASAQAKPVQWQAGDEFAKAGNRE